MNRFGENAASFGTSSSTARRTIFSRDSCRPSTVSATSLYRDSMNSPVCLNSSPNANNEPCCDSTDPGGVTVESGASARRELAEAFIVFDGLFSLTSAEDPTAPPACAPPLSSRLSPFCVSSYRR